MEGSLSNKSQIANFEVKTNSSNLALPVFVKIYFLGLETLILMEPRGGSSVGGSETDRGMM
jgi:hypothetical protein